MNIQFKYRLLWLRVDLMILSDVEQPSVYKMIFPEETGD